MMPVAIAVCPIAVLAVRVNDKCFFRGFGSRCRRACRVFLSGVVAKARLNQRRVDVFIRQARAIGGPFGNRRLQELLVIALREVRLVVSAA